MSTSATPASPDGIDLYRNRQNVAVLRTFSKAYGLAGLRVGFLVGHEAVAEAVRKTMLPFTVNSVAQAAAVASLNAENELLERVETVVKERDRVSEALRADGWTVPETEANFVWLPPGRPHDSFRRSVRRCGNLGPPLRGRRRAHLNRHKRRERRPPRGSQRLPVPGLIPAALAAALRPLPFPRRSWPGQDRGCASARAQCPSISCSSALTSAPRARSRSSIVACPRSM